MMAKLMLFGKLGQLDRFHIEIVHNPEQDILLK